MLLQSLHCCSSLKGGTHAQESGQACVVAKRRESHFCQPTTGTVVTAGIIAYRELYEMPKLTDVLNSFARHKEAESCDQLTLTAV